MQCVYMLILACIHFVSGDIKMLDTKYPVIGEVRLYVNLTILEVTCIHFVEFPII